MKALTPILALLIAGMIVAVGCAAPGASSGNPASPELSGAADPANEGKLSQTHLWGYYDVYIDVPTQTVNAVLNRDAMFTANVVNFVNGKPANLSFHINDTPVTAEYVDVDIDVTINHPFPGLPQYNGYDVRGIFMGDGSASLEYNPDLIYPVPGFDQLMLPDPDDGFGGPDGYTRWFNIAEFSTGGMPLFQYTKGKMASPGFAGTSTLNPYRYYADGLGTTDDLWTWMSAHADQHGVFASGASNTRNYYLRFPNAKGVMYGYAIIASWGGEAPEFHPSNAPEAVALSVVDGSTVFYTNPSNKGGDLKLDISVWDWDSHPSGGVMDDYKIFIESTVLSGVHAFNPSEMTPTGGGESYSTYHVEIPADNVFGNDGNECWVIVEQQGHDYTNEFGVTNLADTDALATLFRYDLFVATVEFNEKPVCDLQVTTPMPVEAFAPILVTFDASASYDPEGGPLSFSWDFDGDGVYGEIPDDSYTGNPNKPTHGFTADNHDKVYVKVTDIKGAEAICSVDVDITAHRSKNIDITYPGNEARDLCMDHSTGDILVLYAGGHVRRYTYSSYYTSSTEFNVDSNLVFIDMGPVDDIHSKAYIICGYRYPGVSTTMRLDHMDSDGLVDFVQYEGYSGEGVAVKDVFAMGSSGTRAYAQIGVLQWDAYGAGNAMKGTHINGRMYYGTPPYSTMTYYINYIQWSAGGYSPTQVYAPWIRGAESDKEGNYVWFLEFNECTASRWNIPDISVGVGNYYSYAGPYFGAAGQPGDQDNRIYDPLDITRDNENHYYILDHLSTGAYTLKAFTYDLTSTTAVGSFGGSSDWDLTPLRVEGSDFNGKIAVLHTSGTNSMVSVFTEDETP